MGDSRYAETWNEREFIGYGLNKPDPKWPGGAKIAVSFVVQYNFGAESSVEEGDPTCEGYLVEIVKNVAVPTRNENMEMLYEFGGQVGVPRLLETFKKHDMPVTFNAYTRALERSPYWIKPILNDGHEISLGGHRYLDFCRVEPEREDKWINESLDKYAALTGEKGPSGWLVERRSNLSIKLYSLAHQERNLPLQYSSDSCSDELPYWEPSPTGHGGLLMIPYTYDTSDARFSMRGSGWASPKDYMLYLKDTFDCLYAEGANGEPKMMTVVLHPHIIGQAGRCAWFAKFLEYIASKPDVWVARRKDIAEHWAKTFPYDPERAFGQTKVVECRRPF